MDDVTRSQLLATVSGDRPRAERASSAAATIRVATAARWVGIYTVSGGVVTNEAWSGPAAPAHPTFPADQGLTAHAITARAIAVSNAVACDPRYLANQHDSGSELIVPIVIGGRPVGTLDVEDEQPGAFGGAAITQFESIAKLLGPLWSSGGG